MKKHSVGAVSLIFLLLGVVIGFFCSPAKNGFGNNSTYNYYNKKQD
jgi:hypothetical protein